MKTFNEFVEKHRITPLKSTLTTRLIELEDAQRLQQVMDASIKVHGEMNSLYDLVFAFLECGRVRQAKKVLEVMDDNKMWNFFIFNKLSIFTDSRPQGTRPAYRNGLQTLRRRKANY